MTPSDNEPSADPAGAADASNVEGAAPEMRGPHTAEQIKQKYFISPRISQADLTTVIDAMLNDPEK